MCYFTVEELLLLHFKVIEDYGGSHGVRDEGRLESVVAAPSQVIFEDELYPTIHEKAAVYLRNIIGDHPFIDGNKRTAITLAIIYLMRNGYTMNATSKELEDFAVAVATEHYDVPQIAAWLKARAYKIS